MLRSLYSGISGLKVQQTSMDVIGNNIANVNTVGFKSSTVRFTDVLYQKSAGASAPDTANGIAGQNGRQIGLGASVGAIKSNITAQGGSQITDSGTDVMINGNAFFVVNSGGTNYFTRNGSFTIDGAGYLSTETGEYVMGYNVDEETGNIVKKEVERLHLYSPENTLLEPEATTDVYLTGNIDQNDTDLDIGKTMQIEFFDSLGNMYSAKLKFTKNESVDNNTYSVALTDVVDSTGTSLFLDKAVVNGATTYTQKDTLPSISFGGSEYTLDSFDPVTGEVTLTGTATELVFNASTGNFVSIGGTNAEGEANTSVILSVSTEQTGDTSSENLFRDIDVDFTSLTMFENSGTSSIISNRGNLENGLGAGQATGTMSGISIGSDGKIYAAYTNSVTKLLGQLASTTFTNPAGLEAMGSGLYTTTVNSGEFDGIGSPITELGLDFTVGALEMSNVDLATEFTNMITTQRAYQANSRVITTSDTLLEELISLKR